MAFQGVTAAVAAAGIPPLTMREAWSGIAGSISLAAWVFVLVPQLVENYKQGSAEGVSLAFLTVWFIGDVANLAGSTWAGLVPTVIALAVYFCFADVALILQCLYYNSINARKDEEGGRKKSTASMQTDGGSVEQPLLGGTESSDGGYNTHRRRGSHNSSLSRINSLPYIQEDGRSRQYREWLKNAVIVLLIVAIGAAGWAIAWSVHVWQPSPEVPEKEKIVGAQILGYISATLYLGARIPQIIKNQRQRSCEGLSLLFFVLSLIGNATYGAGILLHSVKRDYVITNVPWLIGSLGTMVEDVTIFAQFRAFSKPERRSAPSVDE